MNLTLTSHRIKHAKNSSCKYIRMKNVRLIFERFLTLTKKNTHENHVSHFSCVPLTNNQNIIQSNVKRQLVLDFLVENKHA